MKELVEQATRALMEFGCVEGVMGDRILVRLTASYRSGGVGTDVAYQIIQNGKTCSVCTTMRYTILFQKCNGQKEKVEQS